LESIVTGAGRLQAGVGLAYNVKRSHHEYRPYTDLMAHRSSVKTQLRSDALKIDPGSGCDIGGIRRQLTRAVFVGRVRGFNPPAHNG